MTKVLHLLLTLILIETGNARVTQGGQRFRPSPPVASEQECRADIERMKGRIRDRMVGSSGGFPGAMGECRQSVEGLKNVKAKDGDGEQSVTRRVNSFGDQASIRVVNDCVKLASDALNHKSCTRSQWERYTLDEGSELFNAIKSFRAEMQAYGQGLTAPN